MSSRYSRVESASDIKLLTAFPNALINVDTPFAAKFPAATSATLRPCPASLALSPILSRPFAASSALSPTSFSSSATPLSSASIFIFTEPSAIIFTSRCFSTSHCQIFNHFFVAFFQCHFFGVCFFYLYL